MKKLLETLGVKEVIGLNLETTGKFAHKPEPIPEHLGQLCASVIAHNADLGIAVDPDVDRCVLIDETGTPLGEEVLLFSFFSQSIQSFQSFQSFQSIQSFQSFQILITFIKLIRLESTRWPSLLTLSSAVLEG